MAPSAARRAMEAASSRQPALLAYVLASTSESRRAVQELAVYLYYVVLQMFELGTAVRLVQVEPEAVERHGSRNEKLLVDLQSAHPRIMDRVGQVEVSRQLHVMRYVCEALFEEAEPGSDVKLKDDELGLLFLVLKTAVDALDEAGSDQQGGPA